MPIRAWRISYGDGSSWASSDGPWDDAPDDDVQVLVLYHDDGYRTIVQGEDTYWMTGERRAKRGRWMEDSAYAALVAGALADPQPLSEIGTEQPRPRDVA